MFRPLRRKSKAISDEAARDLLFSGRRGIFAVNGDDGYPYALPVNYFYDREADKIYFHGAKVGHKVDAVNKDDRVCFTVYGNERLEEGQWAAYVQSTIVFGRCRLVMDRDEAEKITRTIAAKYYPSQEEIEMEMKSDFAGVQVFEVTIEHLCGKQIQER